MLGPLFDPRFLVCAAAITVVHIHTSVLSTYLLLFYHSALVAAAPERETLDDDDNNLNQRYQHQTDLRLLLPSLPFQSSPVQSSSVQLSPLLEHHQFSVHAAH